MGLSAPFLWRLGPPRNVFDFQTVEEILGLFISGCTYLDPVATAPGTDLIRRSCLLPRRLCHHRSVQILREEFYIAAHAIHLMTRLGNAVVLSRIDDTLDRHLHFSARHASFLRLLHQHARLHLP